MSVVEVRAEEPLPLLTAAQARVLDEAVVREDGDSWDGLLQRAGAALSREVASVLRDRHGGVYGRRVTVVAGKGDNGGDGWVAADRLRRLGAAVTVVAPFGLDAPTSEHSDRARAAYLAGGGRATDDPARIVDVHSRRFVEQPVVVDCLLGTGARGAPRGVAEVAVDNLTFVGRNDGVQVVACDVPSGVDADTGAVAGRAVDADVTVTFGAAKRGLLLHPGRGHVGRLVVASLGPVWDRRLWRLDEVTGAGPWWGTVDALAAPRPWPLHADKRARGRVALVAGSERYGGAAALAAAAAVRAGAGLVTVVTSAPRAVVLAHAPEAMVAHVPPARDDVGGPTRDAAGEVARVVDAADVAVVGPGLGHEPATRSVVEAALGLDGRWRGDAPRPAVVVLDADGCNVFREDAVALADVPTQLVLTPHARELARLLGVTAAQVETDRGGAARELADRTGAVVVAKGPGTIVTAPGGATVVVATGGPALGSGGTGDVLSGLLGATLAAGPAWGGPGWRDAGHVAEAGVAGAVHLHGLLGDEAGRRAGGRGTATDLLTVLPTVLATLAAGHVRA